VRSARAFGEAEKHTAGARIPCLNRLIEREIGSGVTIRIGDPAGRAVSPA
jgi:hypothetical protein